MHRDSLTYCHVRAEAQYQSLQKLLAEFNAFSARAPNARCARGAPARPGSARRWWRYAAAAVKRSCPAAASTGAAREGAACGSLCTADAPSELALRCFMLAAAAGGGAACRLIGMGSLHLRRQ